MDYFNHITKHVILLSEPSQHSLVDTITTRHEISNTGLFYKTVSASIHQALLILEFLFLNGFYSCIAGGCPTFINNVTNTFDDIDIFVCENDDLKIDEIIDKLTHKFNYTCIRRKKQDYGTITSSINNIITVKSGSNKIDLVFKYHKSSSCENYTFNIINNFDMKICRHAWFYNNNIFYKINEVLDNTIHDNKYSVRFVKYQQRIRSDIKYNPNTLQYLCYKKASEIYRFCEKKL